VLVGCLLTSLPLASCDGSATAPSDDFLAVGDPLLGRVAFQAECAGCHATRDGFDLAFFAFTDTTILRRAVAHVDTATALDIVAHVRTLPVAPESEEARIFQPGGEVLASDVHFAARLFGFDGWPLDLTSDALRRVDPLGTPVAVPFPLWSSEEDALDWMPDVPLPAGVLSHRGGQPQALLDRYYRSLSFVDLTDAVAVLRLAERDPANPDAPCVMEPFERFRPEACFESRRWTASLGAQFMLRYGLTQPMNRLVHDAWWDVGNAARRSLQTDAPVEHAVRNWVQWMYAGWAFDPGRHASVYLARGLSELGLGRHAAFHVLRAQVSRGPGSTQAFADARNAARFAPVHWIHPTVRFAYLHLLERLESSEPPVGEGAAEAREHVQAAYAIAGRRLGEGAELAELAELRDRVLDRIGG